MKLHRLYLKGVEEQLTVHPDLPARPLKRVRHPNKDDIVDPKHQHQHQGRLCQFPAGMQRRKYIKRLRFLYQFVVCY